MNVLKMDSELFKERVRRAPLTKLAGDASGREYFRVWMEGYSPESAVLMNVHHPFNPVTDDWLVLRSYFAECGVRVPHLYLMEPEQGKLYIEDCGDRLLEHHARNASCEEVLEAYQSALDLLAIIQVKGTTRLTPKNPAAKRKFDAEKYLWELDFFAEHFLGGLRKKTLSETVLAKLREFFTVLITPILKEPLWFTHRDYHSRNLLMDHEGYIVLDFQDARMGPLQYDLASLLFDSYVRLGDAFRDDLFHHYVDALDRATNTAADRRAFYWMFLRVALQRNLKALGTFGFQSSKKGNEFYLRFVSDTIAYVRRNLPLFEDLRPWADWVISLLDE